METGVPSHVNAPVDKASFAWQPLTPRGVAAFARATTTRLLLVQFVFAIVAAGTMAWFFKTAWFPTISAAIGQLPAKGRIISGKLDWQGEGPRRLAEGRCLAISVDPKHEGTARSPAHVQVEFGFTDVEFRSLLGFLPWTYPPDRNFPFNRPALEPWWGAWSPAILTLLALAVIAGLAISWLLLATAYWLPVWLLGFFANRDLGAGGSWRLAGAALMPGALFLTIAIFLYGLGALDLIRLSAAAAAHWVIGWVYAAAAVLTLPRHPEAAAAKKNPFVPPLEK